MAFPRTLAHSCSPYVAGVPCRILYAMQTHGSRVTRHASLAAHRDLNLLQRTAEGLATHQEAGAGATTQATVRVTNTVRWEAKVGRWLMVETSQISL
jgi:hypothetical protein